METVDTKVNPGVEKLGSYYLQTYGCQMNEYDSELLAMMLEKMNYSATDDQATADVAVFNTCCVRDNADKKVYGRVGDFKNIKLENPNQVLVVSGCLARKDGEAFLERFPQVDVVVGPQNLKDVPELIQRVQRGEGRFVKVDRMGDHFNLPANPSGSHTAMVTISMGCDQWCTFCIVPYVRGRLRSRPLAQVVGEVRRLAREGHREILLLGQNVNDYGRDLEGDVTFATLVEELKEVPGLDRLRFTSPHPYYYSDEVIEAMATNASMCEHVHMPVQSGDDAVLKRMRRLYTRDEFMELVGKIRDRIPHLSVTTDIIVGYPGETEEQFQQTLDLVKQMRFTSAFMYAFSPRPGTPGAIFKDQIDEDVKMDRLYRLIELQNSISYEENQKLIGKTFEVMVERSSSAKDSSKASGRTRCNRLVHFEHGGHDLLGHLVKVELTQAYTWGFLGSMIKREENLGDWALVPKKQCLLS